MTRIVTRPDPMLPPVAIERGPPPGSLPPPTMYRLDFTGQKLIEIPLREIIAERVANAALRAPWPDTADEPLDDIPEPPERWMPPVRLSAATLALLESPRNGCSWPVGDDWCGAPRAPDSSYCPEHHAQAWTRRLAKSKRPGGDGAGGKTGA